MPLINCKIRLKLKRINYCVFSAADEDNVNKRILILFSLSKTQNYMFLL